MFEAILNVSKDGEFSIKRPGYAEDWPKVGLTIRGTEAGVVEKQWQAAVREYSERTSQTRKVIVIRFDSILRKGGKRNFFTSNDATLVLEAVIALENTVKVGKETSVTLTAHPDYQGGWARDPDKCQPFPMLMVLDNIEWKKNSKDICVVEWSPELEAVIVRACNGVQAIVDMLNNALSTPEQMLLAASQFAQLPAPSKS